MLCRFMTRHDVLINERFNIGIFRIICVKHTSGVCILFLFLIDIDSLSIIYNIDNDNHFKNVTMLFLLLACSEKISSDTMVDISASYASVHTSYTDSVTTAKPWMLKSCFLDVPSSASLTTLKCLVGFNRTCKLKYIAMMVDRPSDT